jgi:hypothetical protein
MALRSFNEWMLSEGRRSRRKPRSIKTELKMPKTKSATERQVSDANQRIYLMTGQGDSKTHGKAGIMDDGKEVAQSRPRDRENFRKQMKYGFDD